jgi:His Kinase A (phospho-acceptor) domain
MTLRSMRARLAAAFSLAGTLLIALLAAAVFAYAQQDDTTRLAQFLERQAKQYRADFASSRDKSPQWEPFLRREAEKLAGSDVTIIVLDKNENIVGRTQGNGRNWPHGGNWLVETVSHRGHTLVLAAPWHSPGLELRKRANRYIFLSVAMALVTALGAWLLVGRVLSPIGALSRQARAASRFDSHTKTHGLSAPSEDAEVVELVGTLNVMLDNVTQSTLAKERFYAAASHELRTPLQGLSSLLEFGLAQPRTADEWKNLAHDAYGQSRRLVDLTNDLLALNQLELSSSSPQLGEVDVGDLIERMLAARGALIAQRGLSLQLNLPGDGFLLAPWNHLDMLLRNLLDNAIKYAASNSELRVTWQPGRVTIWNAMQSAKPMAGNSP